MNKISSKYQSRVAAVASMASVALLAALLGATASSAQEPNCQSFDVTNTTAAATPNVCGFDAVTNAAAKTNIKSILLMDWSNGGHSKTHTQRHFNRLAKKYGFRLTRSQSNTYITAATLEGVDIVAFNNGDQDPLSNSTSLTAMRNFVEQEGKGMMAIHAALAFIPCPSEDVTVDNLTTCRWFLRAYRTQFWNHLNHTATNVVRMYVDSVLAGQIPPNALSADITPATVSHGRRVPALQNIFASVPGIPQDQWLPLNGGTGELAASNVSWEGLWDEWYNYRNHPRRAPAGVYGGVLWGPVNILISMDETSYPNTYGCNAASPCKTGDRPVSWTRTVGSGLAAYNNAGHGDAYVRTRTPPGGTVNDSLWEKYSWRLLKYLARDYVGCTIPTSANYNPQATVRSITPIDSTPGSAVYRKGDYAACEGTSTAITRPAHQIIPGIKVNTSGIRIPVTENGAYDVVVVTPNGRVEYNRTVRGGANQDITVNGLSKGFYIVRVTNPAKKLAIARVAVN